MKGFKATRYLSVWTEDEVREWLDGLHDRGHEVPAKSGLEIMRKPKLFEAAVPSVGVRVRVRKAIEALIAACPQTAEELVERRPPREWDEEDVLLWLSFTQNSHDLQARLRAGELRAEDFHMYARGAGPLLAADLPVGIKKRIQRTFGQRPDGGPESGSL